MVPREDIARADARCWGDVLPSRRDTNAEEIICEATSADDGLPATFAIKSLHRQRNYDAIGE